MVRFLADASLNHAIVAGCLRREPAMHFLSAQAAGLHGLSDPAVASGSVRQSPEVIEELVLVWAASEPKDWTNRILEIPLR